MRTLCNSKPLGFVGHCSRLRRLMAKNLIFLLVFSSCPCVVLRAPLWITRQTMPDSLKITRQKRSGFFADCSRQEFERRLGSLEAYVAHHSSQYVRVGRLANP